MALGSRLFAPAALAVVLVLLGGSRAALAHRSGCHNLHTWPSDSNTYVCGDLGYPCDGSTSVSQIDPAKIHVPLLVEKAFTEIFGRAPSTTESNFWKARFRTDKDGLRKIRNVMAWYKTQGSFGPKVTAATARARLIADVNGIFASVYAGRLPTPSESSYWIARTADKTTAETLRGAMAFHRANNIQH